MKRLFLLLVFLPSIAVAWGSTGHKTVCQIALAELTPVARAEVDRLIALDPEFEDFPEACLAADEPERQRPPDHYINVPRDTRTITTDNCPMDSTCLLTAIKSDLAILTDTSNTDADRLLALTLLGHWLGDIHQPMHVSFQDDRGGNEIEVLGACIGSMHSVWDRCIVSERIGNDSVQIAATLGSEISDADRAAWQPSSPFGWANESFQIAIDPTTTYCVQKSDACWYTGDKPMLPEGGEKSLITISATYLDQHEEVVRLRIQQAGVRLGALLNLLD